MNQGSVRIESIEINNFKNVVHGILTLTNPRKGYDCSILGLYGQNGSGKTALIDSIYLLKFALTGMPVPAFFADYINVDASFASFRFKFKVLNATTMATYVAVYSFSIRKEMYTSINNVITEDDSTTTYRTSIFDETLSYSYSSKDTSLNLYPVIQTKGHDVFGPKTKYDMLIGKSKSIATDLLVAKKLAYSTSRSFIFSQELVSAILKNKESADYHHFIIKRLVTFGNLELFIVNTATSGLISMNTLPLAFKYEGKHESAIGNVALSLNSATTVPEEACHIVKEIISCMNVVLPQIVPGLTISVKELGTQLLQNGKNGIRIQLVSLKNNKIIPLQYESDGIKKIISILQLLIVIYNNPSITVAVDELDSGIFEYLLGELLRIISEKGKGQLIFTSHNLRPLETLDRGFIAFTTTNVKNRYIRLCNVKTNHNLRDFYYRDIILGEQNESVYDPTNNYEIAFAFREAGELIGS